MQIAQIVAGYTLGGADLLRRAMGKKNAEAMAKERTLFVDGAVKNGTSKEKATEIFDLMENLRNTVSTNRIPPRMRSFLTIRRI